MKHELETSAYKAAHAMAVDAVKWRPTPITENPFLVDTPSYNGWQEGWKDAQLLSLGINFKHDGTGIKEPAA